jgi:hypothetical protein
MMGVPGLALQWVAQEVIEGISLSLSSIGVVHEMSSPSANFILTDEMPVRSFLLVR